MRIGLCVTQIKPILSMQGINQHHLLNSGGKGVISYIESHADYL